MSTDARSGPRPLIGVTGPARRFAPGRLAAARAIARSGGRARQLGPGNSADLGQFDGFVITGGSDLHPELYGGDPELWSPPDVERDRYELAVLDRAEQAEIPLLGICRGAQLINVHRGGTLYGDITHLRRVTSNRASLLPRKRVVVEPDSRLAGVLRRTALRVNSLHHQAVRRTGEGLTIVARDGDQFVQGVELAASRFVVGVQWHPEYLAWLAPHRRLFGALVEAARAS